MSNCLNVVGLGGDGGMKGNIDIYIACKMRDARACKFFKTQKLCSCNVQYMAPNIYNFLFQAFKYESAKFRSVKRLHIYVFMYVSIVVL